MKPLLSLTSSLALSALLHTACAQTPTPAQPGPAKPATATADQRAATYKGPKVVQDSKALGQKMVKKSKPADSIYPTRPVVK